MPKISVNTINTMACTSVSCLTAKVFRRSWEKKSWIAAEHTNTFNKVEIWAGNSSVCRSVLCGKTPFTFENEKVQSLTLIEIVS